jgi:hypothetical protein
MVTRDATRRGVETRDLFHIRLFMSDSAQHTVLYVQLPPVYGISELSHEKRSGAVRAAKPDAVTKPTILCLTNSGIWSRKWKSSCFILPEMGWNKWERGKRSSMSPLPHAAFITMTWPTPLNLCTHETPGSHHQL